MQTIKKLLKQVIPPPTNSFMREINFLKIDLSQLLKELKEVHEENEKQLSEIKKIREDNKALLEEVNKLHGENASLAGELKEVRSQNKKQLEELERVHAENGKLAAELSQARAENKKQLDELSSWNKDKLNSIMNKGNACERAATESVWAEVFNNTITDSAWLRNQTFSPGRWALGYAALYVLYRILNEAKPKHILELGLGQSTSMITQYAASNKEVEHFVVENNTEWIEFYKGKHLLAEQTQIIQLDQTFVPYKDADAVRVFSGFSEKFSREKFDFIVVDAPYGGDMKQYSRIDILGIIPDSLCDSFTIFIDDSERRGETNTINEVISVLKRENIVFKKGNYFGAKQCTVICSDDNKFITSL